MQKKLVSLLILLTILITGVVLSLLPINVGEGIDKLYHFLAFLVATSVIISLLIYNFGTKHLFYYVFALLLLGAVAGAVTEGLERLTPGRECDSVDWMYDLFGVALPLIIIPLVHLIKSRKNL